MRYEDLVNTLLVRARRAKLSEDPLELEQAIWHTLTWIVGTWDLDAYAIINDHGPGAQM